MGGEETVRLATVIPVFNEAAHIQRCLDGLLEQTIDPSSHMILVLDGGSTDGTQAIVKQTISSARAKEGPRLELLDNPDRTVAHARNLALRVLPSSVELVVELIGHTVVESNHLEQRLEAWEACTALSSAPLGAVGVLVKEMETHSTPTARYIDGALQSPLGQSGGQFSRFTEIGTTDVPAFATHSREALDAVGGWDVNFITSQDSDLSMRMKKAGYALYRCPSPTVAMHKRNRLINWWKMGHRYGFWRTKVLKSHPSRAKWQEFLPWFGLLATVGLYLTSTDGWWVLPGLYGFALVASGVHYAFRQRDIGGVLGVPLCLLLLHVSFSIGLADGFVRKGRLPSDRG